MSRVSYAHRKPKTPMAPRRKRDSDTESSSDDKKKTQKTTAKKLKKTPKKNKEPTITLSDRLRVSISEWKGNVNINIRRYWHNKESDEWMPTKKGIVLSKEEWDMLIDAKRDINAEYHDAVTS